MSLCAVKISIISIKIIYEYLTMKMWESNEWKIIVRFTEQATIATREYTTYYYLSEYIIQWINWERRWLIKWAGIMSFLMMKMFTFHCSLHCVTTKLCLIKTYQQLYVHIMHEISSFHNSLECPSL